ncbi:MAG: hypothetical protein LBE64_08420 [Acinetobacter pittii]|nr:hypothetical protein [Acinetobacter pittii]
MGGIGIWCMHFIGNRAIVLGEGEPHVQAMYNVAFTGTSFVLPVVVLLFAFYAVGVEEKAGYIRILVGGLLTGSAVCGMHYIGQLGISNYRCSYHVANVVGSAVIAIVSSTAALGIFFRWRATWTDSWWRRGICACLLACAVSGMHWTAAVGTIYRDHNRINMHGTQLSRSQVVIICTVLVCLGSLRKDASLKTDSCLGLCCMSHFVDVRYSCWAKSQKVDDSCSSACSRLCLL